eukprot:scaffold10385_cov46-Cyclotella_meneghiniana.AAC.3
MTTTKALAVVDCIIYASHEQVKVMMPYLFITHTGCCLGHLCYAVRGGALCFCAGLLSTTNSQVLCHLPWAQRGQGRGDPSNEQRDLCPSSSAVGSSMLEGLSAQTECRSAMR